MAHAWKCDICGAVSTLFIEDVRHQWFMGDCNSPTVYPMPLDVCNSCFRFLEGEFAELKVRVAIRKEEFDARK